MAESSVIGLLRVLLTADTAQFGTAMDRANRDLEKTGKEAKKTETAVAGLTSGMSGFVDALGKTSSGFDQLAGSSNPVAAGLGKISGTVSSLVGGFTALGPVVGGGAIALGVLTAGALAAGVAVVGIGAGIVSLTTSAADAGDALLTLSRQTGLSVAALTEFQFISKQTDASVDDITRSISKLGQNLSTGSKDTTAALRAIGLSVADIRKSRPEDAFATIITAIGKIPDAGKRAAAGMAIFGKGFKQIAQLTGEDMAALRQQARDLGVVLGEEFALAGDRFNDAIAVIQSRISALTARLGAEFLPVATAFLEVFGEEFGRAMTAAGGMAGGLATTMADVALAIGQSLASVIEVGTPVVAWLVQFFAGGFIKSLGLLDLFGLVLTSVGSLASALGAFDPAMAAVAAGAEAAGAKLRAFAAAGTVGTLEATGAITAYAAAVEAAAQRTGERLPAAVAKVKAEIAAQAQAMRDAQANAGSFGAEIEGLGGKHDKASKAAEAHRKELERLDELLAKRGVLSVTGYSAKLGELVEILNLAAKVGTPALQRALLALTPEFKKLSEQAKQSGQDVAAVAGVFRDFSTLAGLPQIVDSMAAWEAANTATAASLGTVLAQLPQTTAATEGAALQTQILTDAYHNFGQQAPVELRKAADAAVFYYRQLVASGTASTAQLKAAHADMVAAVNAANQQIPSVWETQILPRVTAVAQQLTQNVARGFAAMLTGAASFKDGFVSIWESLKSAVLDILASILDSFINSFLKGMLNALLGSQGGFASAFAGLLSGGAQGAGTGLLGGLVPGLGGAGAAAGGSTGGLLGAGGASTTGGMLGGGVAAGTPWWSTGLGGGLLGAGAGAAVGFGVGRSTGSVAGGAGSGAGTGAAVGGLLGGPLGAGIGAGIGALAGWYGAKKAQKEANDFRDEFFKQVGAQLEGGFVGGAEAGSTFNQLAIILHDAGKGDLFQALIKANDADELRAAIAAINPVLEDYLQTEQDATAAEDAHTAALAAKTAELEKQRTAITDQIKGLDDELAAISKSEAPEAHMGNVEKAARERIATEKAALEAQLAALKTGLDDVGGHARDVFKEIETGGGVIPQVILDGVEGATPGLIAEFEKWRASSGLLFEDIRTEGGGCWGPYVHATDAAFRGTAAAAGSAGDDIVSELQGAAARAHAALAGIGRNLPPVTIQTRLDIPEFPTEHIPGHALGGVFDQPHVAAIAEGGEAEIIGSVGFMTRALEGALGRVGPAAAGAPRVVVVPAFIRGTPTSEDVEYLIHTLVKAEPSVAGNTAGVRTALRSMAGIR